MQEDPIRRRVIVHGRVQGVWFRDSTREAARRHGISGWVRNRADRTVEAVFEGPPEAVARAIAYVHDGPPRARVERLEVFDEEPERLTGFEIR